MKTQTQAQANTPAEATWLQKALRDEAKRPGPNWLALEIKKKKRRKEVRKLYEPKYGRMWKMFK